MSTATEKRRLLAQQFLRSVSSATPLIAAEQDGQPAGSIGGNDNNDNSIATTADDRVASHNITQTLPPSAGGAAELTQQLAAQHEQSPVPMNKRRAQATRFLSSLSASQDSPQPAASPVVSIRPQLSAESLLTQQLIMQESTTTAIDAASVELLANSGTPSQTAFSSNDDNLASQQQKRQASLPLIHVPTGLRYNYDHHARIQITRNNRRKNVFILTRIRPRPHNSHGQLHHGMSKSNHGSQSFDLLSTQPSTRIYLTSPSGVPCVLFSILRYEDEKQAAARKKRMLNPGSVPDKTSLQSLTGRRRTGESYERYLQPSPAGLYNPLALDDPELRTGKHRTVITLPSYMTSIIQYARPSDLKQELNDQLRQKFPELNSGLTLSKIRNLKMHLLQIALDEDLELSTLAKSYAYFEKLVFKNLITKQNRKLYAAICLFLATKINDKKDVHYLDLLQAIEKELGVSSKELREQEFSVFVSLEFSLHIPRDEYMPHLERLIWQLDFNSLQDYLDGKPHSDRPLIYCR